MSDPRKAIVDTLEQAIDSATTDVPIDDAPQPPNEGAGGGNEPSPEVVKACAELDQNDTDNGRRMLNHFGGDMLYVREHGWHAWAGTHWEIDGGDSAVERLAQETARRIKREAFHIQPKKDDADILKMADSLPADSESWNDDQKKLALAIKDIRAVLGKRRADRRKFAVSSGNRARTVAMISQALPHCSVAPNDMDHHPHLFNVANGTLHFSVEANQVPDPECPDPDSVRMVTEKTVTVDLKPHDRANRISRVAPWTYDPKAKCPRYLAFFERFVPDPAVRRFLQAVAGRGLLGGASTQVFIFFYGDGANGKSALMETWTRILGSYAGRLKPESITGTMEQSGDKASPDFARLRGKRLIAISELPRGAPLREGLVKAMTGSEPMPARHLNEGFFDLLLEGIPIMSGNEMPTIGGLDKGIWRRMKFVLFPVTLTDAEQRPMPEVIAEFMEEASGILNWMVEGARIFLAEGLLDPPSVQALTAEHRSDLAPVASFIKHCIEPAPGHSEQARQLYEGFKTYCLANSLKPWAEKAFAMAMKRKGYHREDKRIRVWTDIRMKDVPDRPEEREPRSPW